MTPLPTEDNIRSILGLQGLAVTRVRKEGDEGWLVEAELPAKASCPRCHEESSSVHDVRDKPSRLEWVLLGSWKVWVVLKRRRLRCFTCHKPFTQIVPGLGPRQRMSIQAQASLIAQLAEESFAAIKRSLGISYGRVRRCLERLPLPWVDWKVLVGEEGMISLGIDEHSFRGKDLVITVTCLSRHRVLAVLPNDRQKTLRAFLMELSPRVADRVVGVCIDLKEGFRKVVEEVFPQALVVADHFHVIQDANRRVDETRRLEQELNKKAIARWPLLKGEERLTPKQAQRLAELRQEYPSLGEAHWLKEELRALYGCEDYESAQEHFSRLLINAEEADDLELGRWAGTLRRWRKEILNYFKLPITNAYTEGVHTKMKLIKRTSYGLRNIEIYRRKMMLGFLPRTLQALTPHLLT